MFLSPIKSVIRPGETLEQRVQAHGALAVAHRAGRTRVARLYQDGAAKIRMPAVAADPFEAVLINTAGGLTGGDRLSWSIEAEVGTSISVTTQACEKLYRSAGGHAGVSARIVAGQGARVAWLPQETIVFQGAALRRSLDVELAAGAELLAVESAVFGRRAMGEAVASAAFRDRWRVRREGRLVHAEDLSLGPDIGVQLPRRAIANGATAFATVLVVAEDAARHLDAARDIAGEDGGVSAWRVGGTGKLLARLLAGDGYALRSRLVPLLRLLNGEAGLPKVWSL